MSASWIFLILTISSAIAQDLLVQTHQGTIVGHVLTTPSNVFFKAFQGIPFAQPPLGSLRFQAPRPPLSWQGIRDTTKDANECFAIGVDRPDESEDCLYLNVFTPIYSNVYTTKLPVMLWIHGGGYSHGSSLYSNFGPDYLIEHDIIIVTINYRLGPFGFLATGDTIIPGNAGLKDQAAAIKWTYDNIASFGGDPEKITIAGQSAGSASVGYQILYRENEGRFRSAVLESGSPLSTWSFMENSVAREYAFDLARQINNSTDLDRNTTMLRDFLLQVDGKTIDAASTRTTIVTPLPVIEPEHDTAFLTKSQYDLLEKGDFIHVPIIIGTTSEEQIHLALDLKKLNQNLRKYEESPERLIPSDFQVITNVSRKLVGDNIRDLYLKDVGEAEKMGHIIKYSSHTSFSTSVIKHADLASKFTDVYLYVFSYDGLLGDLNATIKGADKVGHAEDCKYLWKKTDSSYSNADLTRYPQSDVLTLKRMIKLWTNFVKYLDPTPEKSDILQNITWPKFLKNHYKYVDIGKNLEVKEKPKQPYYEAWTRFYENWAEKPFTTF